MMPNADRWAAHHALGPGAEFDVVRELVRRWGDLATGIGDDAAVLDVPAGQRLVVSTDSSVEDVHFRRAWLSPREIGWRAATSALSDLAAMGATPLGIVVAVAVPPAWRADVGALADGVGDAVRAVGTRVLGGDLAAGGELALTVTVLGAAARPVGRDGARAGDALYVTGRLGGPRRALDALAAGRAPDPADRDRFARPVARIAEGVWLAAHGASAMVDVSDGLAADVRHLAAASGVTVCIEASRVPVVNGAPVEDALAGGEEYELAVTAPRDLDVAAFEAAFGTRLTRVGDVVEPDAPGQSGVLLVGNAGATRVDLPSGHDHFSP